jgi:hypothetical protein
MRALLATIVLFGMVSWAGSADIPTEVIAAIQATESAKAASSNAQAVSDAQRTYEIPARFQQDLFISS